MVRLLPPLLAGSEFDAVAQNARLVGADLVRLTADDSDVSTLASSARYVTAGVDETSNRWEESGYWLTPLIALLLLPFFRKSRAVKAVAHA